MERKLKLRVREIPRGRKETGYFVCGDYVYFTLRKKTPIVFDGKQTNYERFEPVFTRVPIDEIEQIDTPFSLSGGRMVCFSRLSQDHLKEVRDKLQQEIDDGEEN